MSHLVLSCLGPFQATLNGTRLTSFHSVKVQALLAYLALEADKPHTRETLATLLWPLDNEASARVLAKLGLRFARVVDVPSAEQPSKLFVPSTG